MSISLFTPVAGQRAGIVPRDYQLRDHDESYRLWNNGEIGVLTRSATGTGKTLMACLKMDTWLARSPSHKAMVVSYERQLVSQFAQEIEDYLGVVPGIEMGDLSVDADAMPSIIVASRQTLMPATMPSSEELAQLLSYGIDNVGSAASRHCQTMLRLLKSGTDRDLIREQLAQLNRQPEACDGVWSRLHKFDWRLHWLVIFDEAHKHARHLTTVGCIVDWFERNHEHRRNGITATPKRGDGVSIGDTMFPAISIDYPLFSPIKPCAVKDGWAVPYVQKYIEVDGVDFKSLPKIGDDFDEAELATILGEESTLAKIVGPLLAMVGNRKTLIFSPTVDMAKDVARFINARAEITCSTCGQQQWHPTLLIGDGAACNTCGKIVELSEITKSGEQAREIDGASPPNERRSIYEDHQAGKFMFLSVCGLCREGYNDPDIGCVCVLRPVSEKASSLAEQMKGRGCRPLRGLLNGLHSREERLAAIAASEKPYCLIVDLVGITGLADCASTVQIYSEGLADEVEQKHELSPEEAESIAREIMERAKEILAERATTEPMPVEDAIAQAKREDDEAREKVRAEREERERQAVERAKARAKAGADVKYTEHDVGYGSNVDFDPDAASPAQMKYASFLGMEIHTTFSKRKAGRIINMLKARTPLEEVARLNGLAEYQWSKRVPTPSQIKFMKWKGVPTDNARTPYDASLLIDAKLNEDKFVADRIEAIAKARSESELTAVSHDLRLAAGILPIALYTRVVEAGRRMRQTMAQQSSEIPD